jgi:uncharacterized protein YdhG (YjbR/CyaY superfamily)
MPATKNPAKAGRFSAEEMAAMKDRAKELKAQTTAAADLEEQLAKIADMPEPDRSMAERIHEIVMASVPGLVPKTYYGMPAYGKNGKSICFFKPASKFKIRYASFGFQPDAKLDDGSMWPIEYALTELTPETEARISELVKKAAS